MTTHYLLNTVLQLGRAIEADGGRLWPSIAETGTDLREEYVNLEREAAARFERVTKEAEEWAYETWLPRAKLVSQIGAKAAIDLGVLEKHGPHLGYTSPTHLFHRGQEWAILGADGKLSAGPYSKPWRGSLVEALDNCRHLGSTKDFILYVPVPVTEKLMAEFSDLEPT